MSESIATGFHAIHANHLEDLRRVVVWICRNQPLPPLESETFLVQSNGIAQWLKLALAERAEDDKGGLGIAAGVDFLFPARFIWQAYRAVLSEEEVPEYSPFDKSRLVWRLYRLFPALLPHDPVFAPLARFVEGVDPEQRRFQLAEKVADLFDQYQVFRADWLSAWEEGHDDITDAWGRAHPLDPELRWQPVLWRALVEDAGDEAHTSRSRIHTRFMEQGATLSRPAHPERLPKRIVVFGVSSLPRQALEALHVLSRFAQVVLCVHNPCRYYWADIVSDRELLTAERKRGARHPRLVAITDPDELHQHANPLLATWGKQGRDYIRLLDEFDNPEHYQHQFSTPDQKIDIFSEHGDLDNQGILHHLQNDILDLRPLSEIKEEGRELNLEQDHSVVFHIAHSPLREVEILHDQLLAAFSTNPELRPRDIMVMVPDINDYAAHIQAVFGLHEPGSPLHIPFTISDQGRRHQEPVLIALETLLSLPGSRFTVSEILSLLEVPALRQRFGLEEDDIPLLRNWVEGSNIRWGLHSQHRSSLDLPPGMERNTWQVGLRSMLLGYAMGDDGPWQDLEPFGEVGGLEAAIVGKLHEFLSQLEALWLQLQQDQSPDQWKTLFSSMLEQFFADAEGQDLLLLNRFRDQLGRWYEDCVASGLQDHALSLDIVKDVLLEGLDEGGLNQRFLAGKVNFATLMPMRSIPFARVCLLGMNDGDYPRSRPPVDFDLMASDYRPGDRSRREDDRYLFLEALLSARQQLYISWVGRSIKDDSERPPSVLVAQLRDYLNSVWQPLGTAKAAEAITTLHPLQPFSPSYFPHDQSRDVAAVLRQRRLFTFEAEWQQVHHGVEASAVATPLDYTAPEEPISLAMVSAFLKKPVESFYNRSLQVYFEDIDDNDSDNEAFALDGLEKWQADNELINRCLLKADSEDDFRQRVDQELDRMVRAGGLGMGITERTLRHELSRRLPNLYQRYARALAMWPTCADDILNIDYVFPSEHGELRVQDSIRDLRSNGQGRYCRVVLARSSLLQGSGNRKLVRYPNLLDDWVIHLAGQLVRPFETLVLAKEEDRRILLPSLEADVARELFETILTHWIEGHRRPLPLQAEAGFAWACAGDDEAVASQRAEEAYNSRLEWDLGYLRAAYENFAALMADGSFPELAEALYQPLWHHEQRGQELLKEWPQ